MPGHRSNELQCSCMCGEQISSSSSSIVVVYLTTNQRHMGYLSSGNGHLAGRYSSYPLGPREPTPLDVQGRPVTRHILRNFDYWDNLTKVAEGNSETPKASSRGRGLERGMCPLPEKIFRM